MYAPRIYGGAEKAVQLLAEGLVHAGHEVVVVAASPKREATTRSLNGVRVHDIGLVNLYWPYRRKDVTRPLEALWHVVDLWNPVMAARAGRILREEAPDVVHTHGLVGFSSRIWKEVAKQNVPLVHTAHDHRLLCVRAAMYKNGHACKTQCMTCRLAAACKRPNSSNVDFVIGGSRSVLDSHRQARFFEGTASAVVPVPVEPLYVEPVPSTGVVRFGYLGRIHPGKGVELILEATRALPREGWEFVIAGDGPDRFVEEMKRLPRHENVRFLGPVRPSEFLGRVDILVAPSQLRESAGLVAVEAFSCGIPVVAAARGGLGELVSDGKTGFLVDPDNPTELDAVLRRLIEHPEAIAGLRDACVEAARPHRVDEVVAEHIGHYTEVIEQYKLREPSVRTP